MKKKLLVILLAIVTTVCLTFALPACGGNEQNPEQGTEQGGNEQSGEEQPEPKPEPEPEPEPTEGLEYTLSNDGTYYIVSGMGSAEGDIVIPSVHNNLPVRAIGDRAFTSNSSDESVLLTSITIPDSITSIGSSAFSMCVALTNITIPDSVTSIGSGAFSGCAALTNITIPNNTTEIGMGAFMMCISLESIFVEPGNTAYLSEGNCLIETASKTLIAGCNNSVIPNDGSVTSIGDYAFCGVTLTDLIIPDSITAIGDMAFYLCTSLKSLSVGNNVNDIGYGAFASCALSLESITVENKNSNYYSSGNCLIETATGNLVLGCQNSIIPTDGNIKTIGAYAFIDCTSLESITIPDGVSTISEYAFTGCTSLKSITIPDSVTAVGDSAFWHCNSLETLNYTGSQAQWSMIDTSNYRNFAVDLMMANIVFNYNG